MSGLLARYSPLVLVLLLALSFESTGCGGSSSGGSPPPPPPPPPPGLSYASPVNIYTYGNHPGSLAIADFNGDGKLDIAVANFNSNTIAVFLNQGQGTFGAPVLTPVQIPNGLGAIALGDFNEDGKPDLIAATISGSQVDLVLLGNGDGTFTQSSPIPNSFGFLHGRVADLNGDKHLDFVGCSNGNISVALGNGDGTFQPVNYLPNGPFPGTYFGCDLGDFNGDGKLDLLAADYTSDPNLVLFLGNGDGTFQEPLLISSGNFDPTSLSAGDFSGTGTLDALVGFELDSASFLSGAGNGTFAPAVVFYSDPGNGTGTVVLAADLNNDGKADALVTDYSYGALMVTLNSGNGVSQQSKTYTFGLAPGLADVAVGDLNGDGLPDIVVANAETSEITVILSQK